MYADKEKTKNAFRAVRREVVELRAVISELKQELYALKNGTGCYNAETLVGAKSGNKVHVETCPFAKNIQPKNKVIFWSREDALNAGYKLCECMKQG
ncbi:MAG: hypothetical protein ACOCZ6_01165 [Nanoarchaeota archaeon]